MALRPYIVGNWKMNGTRALLAEARAIDRAAGRWPAVEVGLAPPATLLHHLAEMTQGIAVGGQDCHFMPHGAHTGDISAAMLADAGARFVILGHSERRAPRDVSGSGHSESDLLVRAKAEAAQSAGLGVILCVGETAAQRDTGDAGAVVTGQLAASLPQDTAAAEALTVAYEPVWAIGTGRVPGAAEVGATHRAIRQTLLTAYGAAGAGVRILYGGSVNADNAAELLSADEVGGALVGGASLTAESFASIISAAAQLQEDA